MSGESRKEIEKTELLVQVARLYYEHNFSQNDIAKKVDLSRPYISKLLNEARRRGIVKIEINDPIMTESRMERSIRKYFGLDRVIIVPKVQEVGALRQVGEAAARYLDSIIRSGDVIGFSWGETVYECVKALSRREDLQDIVAVQMCGGVSNVKKNVYVSEITKVFSEMLNSAGYMLPFPAIVDNEKSKGVIEKEHTMQEVLRHAKQVNIAIMTMGRFGNQCALARAGYLKPEEIEQLTQKGAVGDICTHIIDRNGELCDLSLDERTIAVPYHEIRRIETRIGVAIGDSKVESILGALRGHMVNVFITNEMTAEAIKEACQDIFE
ncbi:MAG: sugar-binding transcriptional regulator [Lachnospiraceae bacterium]